MNSPTLMLILAVADAGAARDCPSGLSLISAARTGNESAKRLIRDILTTHDAQCDVYIELPDELNTTKDLWASELLSDIALDGKAMLRVRALVAWWNMHSGREPWLAREILRRFPDPSDIRTAAIELLARAGDPASMQEKASIRLHHCSQSTIAGRIGIEWPADVLLTLKERAAGRKPVVEYVCPKSRAAEAGLAPGDRILSVEGEACQTWIECWNLLSLAWGSRRPIDVTVQTPTGRLLTRRIPPVGSSRKE